MGCFMIVTMWKILAVIFCVITCIQCAKFGDDNIYTCHCNNDEQCDTVNGVCSGGCARGWSGVSCQKQNVALGKPSSQVDVYETRTSHLAVDGDRTTNIPNKCIDTGNDGTIRWWRVDLQEEYPIKYITIYYQSEPDWALRSLNGFSIYINKENEVPKLCYQHNRNKIGAINDIECSHVITGRYVNISNFHTRKDSRFLILCEVEIFVCADGWTGKTCSQEFEVFHDVIWIIIGAMLGWILVLVLFTMKRRYSKANQPHMVTRGQSSNTVPQPGTTTNQPVTQPSSNNQDNPYDQLTTACQTENAYELLGQTYSKANQPHMVTRDQSSNTVPQPGTTTNQPVTQPSSNNQDNPYDQLTTANQTENAYELLGQTYSKANQSHMVTRDQSSNTVPQPGTTTNQPVTQPSSNNQDNPYDQLTTAYQTENAYELLGQT